ncbi:MAG: Cof-type HAD-IIB family hydrolase [Bacilli bacterium]|nr:Cof-type HAD-IIB family hydrolase [Bacilli bacterium]MDY6392141.1 Cof-type HAD-IIB family hydrolase [Bacilli bacterium]
MNDKVDPKNIKIVFTDIDGTFFSHVSGGVPQSSIAAVHDLQAKGIKFFLCSGRNFYLVRKSGILSIVHPDGMVTMNGGNAIIGGKIIYRYPIPEVVVDKLILFAKKLKFGLTLIEENEGHINMIDDRVISAHEKYGTRFPQPRHFPDHYDRTVYQMIAFCDEIEESLFLPHLQNCKSARWDEFAVDIMPMDSDKSKGIQSVLDYYGFKPEEAMCFGDGNNDVEMLRLCGIGVAMGNAVEAAKEAADYVTDDIDENGWCNALKHFKLIG